MSIFKGAGVAIVTPMKENLDVNYDKLEELINFHVDNGTDAIIIAGTTGESSTLTMEEQGCSKPVLTMSMSGLGSITRLTGEVFSSCATFGSVGKSSAPGQIPLEKLITVLDTIHDSL